MIRWLFSPWFRWRTRRAMNRLDALRVLLKATDRRR